MRGPIGPRAGYLQAAWIALHVMASQSAKGGKLKFDDFVMKFDRPPKRRMTAGQMMTVMRGLKDPFK